MRTLIYPTKMIGGQCKDCPDRQIEPVNCHTYCEKYLEASKKWQEHKHNMNKAMASDYNYDRYKSESVRKTKEYIKKHRPSNK